MLDNITKEIQKISTVKTPEIGWWGEFESMVYGFLEFGGFNGKGNSNYVPARPHRLETIIKYKNSWMEFLSKSIERGGDLDTIMSQLADIIHNDYLEVLYSGDFEDLAESTIKQRQYKGIDGTTPLVATHHMQNSLEKRLTNESDDD